MALYVVGTSRNKLNTKAIIGYYVWNTEDNSVELMPTKLVREVMLDGIADILNIELEEQYEFTRILGKNYSLDALTQMIGDEQYYRLDDYTVLAKYDNNTYLIAKFDGSNIDSRLCSADEMIAIQKQVWNYSLNSHMYSVGDSSDEMTAIQKQVWNYSPNSHMYGVGNSSEDNDNIEKIQARREELLKQAYDKTVVWTLPIFKEFMKLMGWGYELQKTDTRIPQSIVDEYKCDYFMCSICNVDESCEVLHLPIEICGVSAYYTLFKHEPTNLDTIILGCNSNDMHSLYVCSIQGVIAINSDVVTIKLGREYEKGLLSDYSYDAKVKIRDYDIPYTKIKNVYKQEPIESWIPDDKLNLGMLQAVNITNDIELNSKKLKITQSFNMCILNKPFDIEAAGITFSFRHVKMNTDRIYVNAEFIKQSFIEVQSNQGSVLALGDKLEDIQNSFNMMNVQDIDLSRVSGFNSVVLSFNYLKNITNFDMSHFTSHMGNFGRANLQSCDNLENLVLPNSIRKIGRNNIEGSPKVQEVVIPESARFISGEPFCNGVCRVIYPKKVDVLKYEYMADFRTAENYTPVYQNTITVLENTLNYVKGDLKDLKLPVTLRDIPEKCFSGSDLKSYDSRLLPEIHTISSEMFKDSTIQTAYLLDNITSIGECVFSGCAELRNVILGKNIEDMPSRLFKGFKPEVIVKVYVVKNSLPHKKIKSNSKITVIEVNSTEEALEMCNSNITPENKKFKYEMLLGDTEYARLLEDSYIGGVSYLYPLLKALNSDESYMQDDIELDTTKFKPVSLQDVSKLAIALDKIRGSLPEITASPRRFISMCNLITKLSDNVDECFSQFFINRLNTECTLKNFMFGLYIDDSNAIVITQICLDGTNNSVFVLYIVHNNELVYMTPYYNKMYEQVFMYRKSISFLCTVRERREVKYHNIGLGTILLAGDNLMNKYGHGTSSTVHGLRLPMKFSNLVVENILDTCIAVGILNFEKKSRQQKQDNVLYDILFYELINGTFIECTADINFINSDRTAIESVSIRSIRQTYKLKDIDSINPDYFDWLRTGFNDKLAINTLKLMATSDEHIKYMQNNIENYDVDGDMNIAHLGELFYHSNIKSVQDLVQNRALSKSLLDSHLYENANISMNYIKKYDNVYKRNTLLQLKDSNEILIEFEARGKVELEVYIAGLADGNTSMSSKKFLKGSMVSLQDTVRLLYSIGQYRENKDNQAALGIDNLKTDMSKFYVLLTKTFDEFVVKGMKLHLALDLYNADTYIIGDVWDTSFFKLFRTKNMKLGIQLFKILSDSTIEVQNLIGDLNSGNTQVECRNTLKGLRQDIMDGLPNNVPYAGKYMNLAEILAKQPKIIE